MTSENIIPRIDVWGSCVSRDTLELMSDVQVGMYVARQSAIVSTSVAASVDVPIERLDSDFQKRMLVGDAHADVSQRLSDEATLVLIDLVDERRGVWSFPSGGYLTNSIEASKTGVDEWAPQRGARLIEFGTDEHFDLWQTGFVTVMRRFARSRVPTILLDIAWAEVADGQPLPHGIRAVGGSIARRLKRGSRTMSRELVRGEPLSSVARGFVRPGTSKAEEIAAESQRQNRNYRRYVEFAQSRTSAVIHRSAADVRMDREHKWGLSPYHYRQADYQSIANEIRAHLRAKATAERRRDELSVTRLARASTTRTEGTARRIDSR